MPNPYILKQQEEDEKRKIYSQPKQTVQQPVQQPTVQMEQPKRSATQELMQQPEQPKKWYKGESPTAGETMARIYQIGQKDYSQGRELFKTFQQMRSDPSSKFYNPYTRSTNQAVQELANLGYDMTKGVTQDWLNKNSYLMQYYRTGVGGNPLGPTKTSTKEQNAAYWYYRLLQSEDTTKQAEDEWKALQEEISYWTSRKDRNYSDDEILAKIDWSKYKTLAAMDEGKKNGTPVILNRSIGYSRDDLAGVIWAARNGGGTGDPLMNATKAAMGEGNTYQRDETLINTDDPTQPGYNPYAYASTLDDAAKYFSMYGFDQKWIDEHRSILTGNDETAKRYYNQILAAEETTRKAEEEWSQLQREIAYWTSRKDLNLSDEQILSRIDMSQYKTLQKLDETRQPGTFQSPLDINRRLGYSQENMKRTLQSVRDYNNESVWKENPEITAMLDATSDKYNPNAVGCTLDEPALYFDVSGFNRNWIDDPQNIAIMNGNDATAKRMYQAVYKAEMDTRQAEDELQALLSDVSEQLKYFDNPHDILDGIMKNYPMLSRIDKGLASYNPVELTRAVHYRYQDLEAWVTQECTKKHEGEVQGPEYVQSVVDRLNAVDTMKSIDTKETPNTEETPGKVEEVPSKAAEVPSAKIEKNETRDAINKARNKSVTSARPVVQKVGTPAEKNTFQYTWPVDFDDRMLVLNDAIMNGIATWEHEYQDAVNDANTYVAGNYLDALAAVNKSEKYKSVFDGLQVQYGEAYAAYRAKLNAYNSAVDTAVETGATTRGEMELAQRSAGSSYMDLLHQFADSETSGEDNPILEDILNGLSDNTYDSIVSELDAMIQQTMTGETGKYNDIDEQRVNQLFNRIATEVDVDRFLSKENPVSQIINSSGVTMEELNADRENLKQLEEQVLSARAQWLNVQSEYDEAQKKMQKIRDNQDTVTRLAALHGEQAPEGNPLITVLDYAYALGSQYIPTEYNAYSVYEYAVQNGQSYEDTANGAKADRQEYEEMLKNIDYVQAQMQENNVAVPQNYLDNITRAKAKCQRDIETIDYFLLQGNSDFSDTVEEAREAAINAWSGFHVFDNKPQGFSERALYAADVERDLVDRPTTQMVSLTQEERDTYLYLYAKEGEEAADKYYDFLTGDYGVINTRNADQMRKGIGDMTRSSIWAGIGMNVYRALLAPAELVGTGKAIVDTIAGRETNPDSSYFGAAIIRGTVSQVSKEEIDKIENPTWKKLASIGYDVGTSMGDNVVNMATFSWLGGGISNEILSSFVTAIPMAAEAAGSTMQAAKKNGASQTQMLALGGASFLAESLTEAITVGNIKAAFTKGGTEAVVESVSQMIIGTLKDMGEEALGEGASEILESTLQNFIYKNLPGLTIDDIGEKDFMEIVSDAAYASLLGAISGGLFKVTGDISTGKLKQAIQLQFISQTSGMSASDYASSINEQITRQRAAEEASAEPEQQAEQAGPEAPTEEQRNAMRAQPEEDQRPIVPRPDAPQFSQASVQSEQVTPEQQPTQSTIVPNAEVVTKQVSALQAAMATDDIASKTATMGAVLLPSNAPDFMQNGTVVATVQALSEQFGGDDAIVVIRDMLLTAAETQMDTSIIPSMIEVASLSNGESNALLSTMVSDGVTPERLNQFVEAAQVDSQSPDVQNDMRQAVYDAQVAERTKQLAGDGAFNAVVPYQNSLLQAKQKMTAADERLEQQNRLMQAASDRVQNLSLQVQENPGDSNLVTALNAALDAMIRQSKVVTEYKQSQQNAQYGVDTAQQALDSIQEQTALQVRQQARQDVNAAREQYFQEQSRAAEENALALAQQQAEENERTGLNEDIQAEEITNKVVDSTGLQGEQADALRERVRNRIEQYKAGNVDTSQSVTSAEAGKVLGRMARKLGVEIRFGDLPAGRRGKYENGVVTLSNKLTIGQAMVETALHEITHSVEATKAYQNYHDFVLNTKYSDPITLHAAVDQKIAEYAKEGIKLTEEGAKKELVAEFARTDLHNKDTVERLVDNGLGGVIRNALHNVNQFLKNMKLTGQERVDAENLRKAERMLQKAINQRKMTDTHPAAAQFSVPQLAQSMGLYFDENTLQLYDRKGGNLVETVTPEMLNNTPIGMMIDLAANGMTAANGALKFSPTISQETAQAQKKMFADLMSMCAKYKDSDLVWEIASSTLESTFSALKSNSDPQYKTTVDFGTVCAKTQEIINVLSKTMLEKSKRTGNGGLTREDIMKAYNETFNADLTVPCPVCYVFSRWMGVPSLLGQMQQYQKNYVVTDENGNIDIEKTQEKADAYVKQAIAKYGDAKKINSAKSKIQGKLKKAEDTRVALEQTIQLNSKEGGDAKKVADAQKKLDALLKRMVSLDEQLGEVEAYNWVTQALCAQDENKQLMHDENGKVVIDPEFRLTPDDVLFDLNRTGEFAKYTKNWQYRNTRGAGMGKAILPYSGETLGDIIYGVHSGGRWAADQNPFTNLDPQRAANAIKNAIERARVQNLVGGQRLQSTSDFRPEWGLDYMMTFLEMQAIGSKAQMYTKVAEAVDFLASCGGDVNCSVMGKGQGWHIDSNGNYVLDFSDTTGMNYETAVQYKNKYDSVQLILVGMNDTHVRLAIANSDIDFVIPWHSSGNSKDVLASLIGSVGEHLDASVDYTKFQTDMVKGSSIKYKDENGKTIEYTAKGKQTAEEKARWDARVKLLTGEDLTLDDRKIIYSDKYLKGLYDRFYGTKADGTPIDPDCYGVKLPKAQANQIFPYEYWVTDPSLPGGTKDTADVNGQRFVEYCESMGLVPRFSQFKDDPGYWKLLIDRKMYDNNGNYRRQQTIDVTKAQIGTLENGKLTGSQLPKETSAKYGSRYSEQEQQAVDNTLAAILPQYDVQGDFSVTDGLTDADVDQLLAEKDLAYMDAVESGDMETAQRMVQEKADAVKAEVFAATDVPTYRVRRGFAPRKTIKVYKTFTLDKQGRPSALFVSSQHAIPVGVWLDAQDTFHFTDTKNGRMYVPSTKNPNTDGGATGRQTSLDNISPEDLAKMEELGYVKRDENGNYTTKNITSLAYRPGWHAGDLPFFPQGGMKIEGSNYENVHRYNQVVFECEMAADTDFTSYDIGEDGKIKYKDMQKMPESGSYKFATNPMANSQDIGAWYISGALKINRALTEEECNQILEDAGYAPQEWQAFQDKAEMRKIKGKENKAAYEKRIGPLDLDALGYDPKQTDGGKKLLDPVTYDDDGNVIPLSKRFNPDIQDPRYSIGGGITDADIDQMLVETGLITQEQADAGRSNMPATTGNITIPPNIPESASAPAEGPQRQRQFGSQTAQRSNALHDEVKQYLRDHSAYTADSNREQIDRAIGWVQEHASDQDTDGYFSALDEVLSPNFNYMSADGQARMLTVLSMAALKGDVASETRIADAYNQQGTEIGRTLQARQIFNMMTPLGRISTLKHTADKINQRYIDQGKSTRVKLSEETLRLAGEAKTADDFTEVKQRAYKELAEQMPADWKEKLRAIRYFSMLFNPVTHIRNVLGNAGFMPAIAAKNVIGTGLEKFVKGEKTKAIIASKESRTFAKADATAMKDVLTGEAKYNSTDPVEQERKYFGKALQGLMDFNSNLLEAEDWMFLRRHYANALSGWMTANNATPEMLQSDQAMLDRARAYAVEEAQKATYRDASKFASMMSDISRRGGAAGFIVDAALPFKKTPTNILKRGIEYSPLGLIKTVVADSRKLHLYNQWVKNGQEGTMPSKAITPTQYVDRIASGLSGTGIAAIGALMSAMGWLKVGLDDDDEIAKQNGEQEYALKVNLFGQDVSYTIDWLAPSSMPLFVGASIYNEIMAEHNNEDALDVAADITDSFLRITEPVFNLSMLDGVNSLLQTSSWSDTGNNITDIGATLASNYVTSFVPTLAGKVAKTLDTTRRETFVPSGTSKTKGLLERTWQKTLAKVPGATTLLKPYVSPLGEEEKTSTVAVVLQNFISPGYFKTVEISDMEKEMQRLHEATGENSVVPKQPSKFFTVDGEKLNLDAEQYTELQKTRGTTAKDLLTSLVESPEYQVYGDDARVKMIEDAWTYATEIAKHQIDPNAKMDSWVSQAQADGNPLQALIQRREDAAAKEYVAMHKKDLVKAVEEEDIESAIASIHGLYNAKKDKTYVRSYVTTTYKPTYVSLINSGETEEAMALQATLMQLGLGYTSSDFKDWVKKKKGQED